MPIFPNQYPEKLNPKATDKLLMADGESGNAIKSVQAEKISNLVCPFPVGSIYMSVDGANPSTIWAGTTWAAFASGRTIVGVDTSQTEFDAVEKTGGEKNVTLTIAQMPAHEHDVRDPGNFPPISTYATTGGVSWFIPAATSGVTDNRAWARSTGGGNSHNNLSPYITTYIWKRTA